MLSSVRTLRPGWCASLAMMTNSCHVLAQLARQESRLLPDCMEPTRDVFGLALTTTEGAMDSGTRHGAVVLCQETTQDRPLAYGESSPPASLFPNLPSVDHTIPTFRPRFFFGVSYTFRELWLDFHQSIESPRHHAFHSLFGEHVIISLASKAIIEASSSQLRLHGLSARHPSGDTLFKPAERVHTSSH